MNDLMFYVMAFLQIHQLKIQTPRTKQSENLWQMRMLD